MSIPPEYQKLVEEAEQRGESRAWVKDVLVVLEERFGPRARELEPRLTQVEDEWRESLLRYAVVKCPNLEHFGMRI
jgi:hypothetical protein